MKVSKDVTSEQLSMAIRERFRFLKKTYAHYQRKVGVPYKTIWNWVNITKNYYYTPEFVRFLNELGIKTK